MLISRHRLAGPLPVSDRSTFMTVSEESGVEDTIGIAMVAKGEKKK